MMISIPGREKMSQIVASEVSYSKTLEIQKKSEYGYALREMF